MPALFCIWPLACGATIRLWMRPLMHGFRRILELLEPHGVEYVAVGGAAAVLQGAPVTTFDVDVRIKVDAANIGWPSPADDG